MTLLTVPQEVEQAAAQGVIPPTSPKGPPPLDQEEGWLDGVACPGLRAVLAEVRARDPLQPEFLAAVKEVAVSLQPVFERRPELLPVFLQLCEPERQIMFRVAWLDDAGRLRINRGYRVQHSSAIGPYKGGLRFHPTVTLSVIKFLAFEQVFKNSLTTLPMGGGKGGSDFDPKGKSDAEIQRFCQSFMTELACHIGPDTDVPAGDIGVGQREIGFLFGWYKRMTRLSTGGVLTGKGLEWGGSALRPEATGYGAVFFAKEVLQDLGQSLQGMRCVVSGSGNVAQNCAWKLLEEGATVLGMSDSRGYVYEPAGLTKEQIKQIMAIKSRHDGRLEDLHSPTAKYVPKRKIWELDARIDAAFPCATQHELDAVDAEQLVGHGCKFVFEGANMPCTSRAVRLFETRGVVYTPSKATNAGGVAVSGLEMSQDRQGMQWSAAEVDARLHSIMTSIYRSCKAAAEEYGTTLAAGANIAGFLKVAEACLAQGAV